MVRAHFTRFLAAAAVIAATLPLMAQTADKVISDQILPKETFVYVSFPNVTALKEQVAASSFGKLWNDPALDAFKAEVNTAIETDLDEGLVQFQEQMGMTLNEFLQIPSGEVSLAVSGGPGNSMGAVIFLDFGNSEAQVLDLLDRGVELLSQNPRLEQEDESFDGTELTMFRIQYNGRPAPTPLAKEFGWFVKDQRLVISNRIELLQAALTNWSGEEQSFMDNESYSYILGKCQTGERSALSTFYFDPINLFTKLVQTGSLGQQATMGAGMALGVMPMLGVNQLRAMGGVTQPGGDDFEILSRSVVYADQPATGLMRVFQLDQMEQTPPAWVKDNVHAYAAMKWKIADAYEAIESLIDNFQGAGATADQLDRVADGPAGIHVKHDVVDQLTGEIRLITAAGEAGYGGDQILFVLGVRDNEAASDVVARVADRFGLQTREFRGATIHEMNGPTPGQGISVTVNGNRLLFCIGGTLLEQILRNDSDLRPLAESDEYRKIAQHFPSSALSVQFSRPAEQYRSIYEMLRSGAGPEQFPGSQEFFEKIDFTTLPEFDTISKYIRPSGGFTVKDDNGVMMQAFQLKSGN